MRALKTLTILGISPILHCSACRNVPLVIALHDLRPQCLPQSQSAADKRFLRHSSSSAANASPSTLSYRIGASFTAKNRRFDPQTDSYSFDPDQRAQKTEHVTGKPNSGQDAFFVSRIGSSRNVAFGVTDGVGGWADSGIDSAIFSHGLCLEMARSAAAVGEGRENEVGPRQILQKAYEDIIHDQEIDGGGSTACVAVGREDGNLTVANLGDSGFLHLRHSRLHYTSNPQTHAFNTPYQLSIVPPRVLAISRALGGSPLHDLPSDAHITTHAVQHGDVLVFATDGVWDNLDAGDVLRIVSRTMRRWGAWTRSGPNDSVEGEGGESGNRGVEVSDAIRDVTLPAGIAKPQSAEDTLQTLLAVSIADEAKAASVNSRRDGPFAREVRKRYPLERYRGGKVDDICVVVAIVVGDEVKG